MVDAYLSWLSVVLLGYALMGKGFAYIGISPLYVGEVTLILGLLSLVFLGPAVVRAMIFLIQFPQFHLLLAMMIWGAVRTLPYLPDYGLLALRDAAIWGYSVYSLIIAAILMAKPWRLNNLLRYYKKFSVVFLIVAPLNWLIGRLFAGQLPTLPGSDVSLVYLKPGDILVHLSGVAAFTISGFTHPSYTRLLLISLGIVLVAFENRGGMLAFALALLTILFLKPLGRGIWRFISIAVLALSFLWITAIKIDLGRRQLSFEQIVKNVESVVSSTEDVGLESTKMWRVSWWGRIVDYTIYGEYFWTGKGFGINLADDDGFQVFQDHSLRSPHNAHLNILARAGVPGFLLWLGLHASWAIAMVVHYLRSRLDGQGLWASLFLFLLTYWLAFIVNASFDVFLEGPVGGIWFWVIYGIGLAAMWIYRCCPNILQKP